MTEQDEIKAREDGWRQVVVRAWKDEKFKRALLDNPNKVLSEAGIPLRPGVNFVVVENEPHRVHLVLPARPSGEITAQQAENVSLSDYNAATIVL